MESVTFLSNAKINLLFFIHAIRPDHYCDISTVMLPVNFGDTLTFSKVQSNYNTAQTIEIHQNSSFCFDPLHNTIRSTINAFQKITGIQDIALDISIEKRIPIGSGFGGGSSNAIYTLHALNHLYGNILPETEYLKIAKEIGMDCVFFIANKPQLATDRGDVLCPLPQSFCKKLSTYFVLLFCPRFSIMTQWAYDQFKKNPSFQPQDNTSLELSLLNQSLENVGHNAFEELVFHHYPSLKSSFETLRHHGHNPHLSGSGSGCFIIHHDRNFLESAKPLITQSLDLSLLTITTFKIE